MLCWGTWSNTQKLVTKNVTVSLFYRDYLYGITLTALLLALTAGSLGSEGRSFLADIQQADYRNLLLAVSAGVIFNAGNRLLVAGIGLAGIAIAMPVGTGLALVLGLVVNYVAEPEGNLVLLAVGGGLVILAMLFGAQAYRTKGDTQAFNRRGLVIVLLAGLLNGFFFRLITSTLPDDLANPAPLTITPFTAFVAFVVGLLISIPVIEPLTSRFIPEESNQTAIQSYGDMSAQQHLAGLLGGVVWGIGMGALLLASQPAGSAISFGLSQGATIVAVLCGLFVWHEFAGAPPVTHRWLWLMGVCYVIGIALIVVARLTD
jgi:glucose uptake protein